MSQNFRKVIFSKFAFSISKSLLDTRYEYSGNQNNNPAYLFNNQLHYVLVNYFIKSKATKRNIAKFLSNLLMKPIIKKLHTDK